MAHNPMLAHEPLKINSWIAFSDGPGFDNIYRILC